jgi:hypothetical protein
MALTGGIAAACGLALTLRCVVLLVASSNDRGVMIMLLGLGLVFATLGGFLIISAVVRWRRAKRAQKTGEVVYAAITGVHQVTTTSVKGVHPYYLSLEWTDPVSGRVTTFRSEPRIEDPTNALALMGVSELPVHVTVEPPAHYVDDSILRQEPSELR